MLIVRRQFVPTIYHPPQLSYLMTLVAIEATTRHPIEMAERFRHRINETADGRTTDASGHER